MEIVGDALGGGGAGGIVGVGGSPGRAGAGGIVLVESAAGRAGLGAQPQIERARKQSHRSLLMLSSASTRCLIFKAIAIESVAATCWRWFCPLGPSLRSI